MVLNHGNDCRQGPHHEAQKSTSTTFDRSPSSATVPVRVGSSKLTAMGGSGLAPRAVLAPAGTASESSSRRRAAKRCPAVEISCFFTTDSLQQRMCQASRHLIPSRWIKLELRRNQNGFVSKSQLSVVETSRWGRSIPDGWTGCQPMAGGAQKKRPLTRGPGEGA